MLTFVLIVLGVPTLTALVTWAVTVLENRWRNRRLTTWYAVGGTPIHQTGPHGGPIDAENTVVLFTADTKLEPYLHRVDVASRRRPRDRFTLTRRHPAGRHRWS